MDANVYKQLGIAKKVIIKSQRQFMYGSNFFGSDVSIRTEKLHRIKVKKSQKNFGKYFFRGKNQFFWAKKFNVSTTKTL